MRSFVRYALENGGTCTNIKLPKSVLGRWFSAANPTCAVFGGDVVFNSRLVDYRKILQGPEFDMIGAGGNQTYFLHKTGFESKNAMFNVHNGLADGAVSVDYGPGVENSYYRGFEDCRLVVWDGVLYAYGTRWDKVPGKGVMCIYRLGDGFVPVQETVVKSPFGCNCEKNWAALEGMPFCFIYQYNPMVVVRVADLSGGDCEVVFTGDADISLPTGQVIRGSSQAVSYGGGWIATVHMSAREGDDSFYRTAFVLIDKTFRINKMSEWFVFRTDLSEFTCGLCMRDGFFAIPYSQCDCSVEVLEVPCAAVMRFVDGCVGDCPLYGLEYIHGMALSYDIAEQNTSAEVFYDYTAVLAGISSDVGAYAASRAFSGLVSEFPNIVEPSFFGKVEDRIRGCIVESGGSGWLYKPLSEACRYCGKIAEAEKYHRIFREKTAGIGIPCIVCE